MLQGLLAPLRVVLQRSFADWLIVVATWLVILCATMLVAIGVMYGDAVAKTGLDRLIAAQPATATSVTVEMRTSPAELPDTEAAIGEQVERILRWTDGERLTFLRSDTWRLPEADDAELTPLAVFGSFDGIENHAELLDGSWPDDGAEPMQAALSQPTADALGLGVGDAVSLGSQRGTERSLDVVVTGIWQPTDPTDAFWTPDSLELLGRTEGSTFATYGPFVTGRADLLERTVARDVALEVRAIPAFANLAVDDVGSMRADTAALERRIGDVLGEREFFHVSTDLDDILESAGRSLLVSRSGVVVLTIQFAVLAGYALLLVAGLLVEQRRIESALLRSRGAGVPQVALLSFLEALILVVPAVVAAPWLAVGVLNLLNVSGPLADAGITIAPHIDGTVMLAAAGAGLACLIGLVLPALGAGRGLAAVRQTISRQGNRTLAQRLGFDLALVVLAGMGLWQLRQYGAPLTQTVRGSVGLDPLLVAAPAIGLLAGSILALRIVPLAAELAERILTRRRGLVAPLGARQLSRRPLRYTRSALLLMLAAALGTFAGAYASTWTRSQADQAAYRTASDVRVQVSGFPDLPDWAIGQAYRAVDGVEVAVPVARDEFDVADGDGTLIALDTSVAASTITFRSDLADEPIDQLLATLPDPEAQLAAIPIPDDATHLTLELSTTLHALPASDDPDAVGSAPLSPAFRGIVPTLVVRDADGLLQRLEGPRALVAGVDQHVEFTFDADAGLATPAYPLELLAVELMVQLPDGVIAVGTVDLTGLTTAADPSAPGTPLDVGDLSWSRIDAGTAQGGASGTESALGAFGTPIAFDERTPILGTTGLPPSVLRLGGGSAAARPIPALASSSLIESMGVGMGQTVDLGSLGTRRQFVITGVLSAFPTVDPSAPFIVTDLGTLAVADAAAGRQLRAAEWWIQAADGQSEAVAETLRGDPYSAASVTTFDELHRDLLSDPIALGVIGALALGAVAAVIFAGIGFIVSATVSTRERLSEFALLQAIGLSHRQLSGWLTLENAFLLATGLLVGTGLGLVLAWVVLPFVTLTQEATLAVPPVEVVIPWGIYGVLYLVAGVALVATVIVIGQLLARVRVSGVLRSGGE